MDWSFLEGWLDQTGLTPGEVYTACREYLLKQEYVEWRSDESQMEFNFG